MHALSRVEHSEEEVRQAVVLLHQVHSHAGEGESHPVRVPAEVVALRVVHQLDGRTSDGRNGHDSCWR